MDNPLLGVAFHWIGGVFSAGFYVPFRRVRGWSWEVYWIVGGLFSWLIAPWIFAWLQTSDFPGILADATASQLLWPILFGVLWGFGSLSYGLTMRYLGLSLGMAVVLGLTVTFGTLVPPLFFGTFQSRLIDSVGGNFVLLGVAITIVGIVAVGWAGARKDRELGAQGAAQTVPEFNFRKGIAVAIFSGVMSSSFAFGLIAAEPIRELSRLAGTSPLWTGLPALCLVMLGGLFTNGVWCAYLMIRNATAGELIGAGPTGASATVVAAPPSARPRQAPLLANYVLCAIAGVTWYAQSSLYTMGESQMGPYGFTSWTIHTASVVLFGTLFGFAFGEWRNTTTSTRIFLWAGVALLALSTVTIGYGNGMAG